MKELLRNSCILITGGTGTFGRAFLKRILEHDPKEVRIFSRDEKKQYELSQKYCDHTNIKYIIGDIRDKNSVSKAMKGVDYVLHSAAMKQVPTCELYPLEAFNTNVIGSSNVLESAIENHVKKIVCISTDKAVEPYSTMGLSKAYMEKIALQKAAEQNDTCICLARFCNLIISDGSAVPLFIKQLQENKPLTITNPKMTRYFISIKQAVDLIEQVFLYGKNKEIYIKKAKACLLEDLVEAVLSFKDKSDYPTKTIGARPGEKDEEFLYAKEEQERIREQGDCLIISGHRGDFNYFAKDFLSTNEIVTMIQESLEYEL